MLEQVTLPHLQQQPRQLNLPRRHHSQSKPTKSPESHSTTYTIHTHTYTHLFRGEKAEVLLQIRSRGGEIGMDAEFGEDVGGGLEGRGSHRRFGKSREVAEILQCDR
jgi:hypothetical protein